MRSFLAVLSSIGFAAAGGGCWALWHSGWGLFLGFGLMVVALGLIAARDAEFEELIAEWRNAAERDQ